MPNSHRGEWLYSIIYPDNTAIITKEITMQYAAAIIFLDTMKNQKVAIANNSIKAEALSNLEAALEATFKSVEPDYIALLRLEPEVQKLIFKKKVSDL